MKNKVLLSILVNSGLALAFVLLNNWALKSGLEETFTAIALIYGFITIMVNGVLTTYIKRK